jgi:hypothetical protein
MQAEDTHIILSTSASWGKPMCFEQRWNQSNLCFPINYDRSLMLRYATDLPCGKACVIQWRTSPQHKASLVPRRLFIGPLADSYASTWFREQLGEATAGGASRRTNPHWEIFVYEVLNFTDGKRSLAEIEDAVRAEFGDVPDGTVEHILRDLKVKLVEFTPPKQD